MGCWSKTFFSQFCIFFFKLKLKKITDCALQLCWWKAALDLHIYNNEALSKPVTMELTENHPTFYCFISEQKPVVNVSVPNRKNHIFECYSEHSVAFRIEVFLKKLILFYFFLGLSLKHPNGFLILAQKVLGRSVLCLGCRGWGSRPQSQKMPSNYLLLKSSAPWRNYWESAQMDSRRQERLDIS